MDYMAVVIIGCALVTFIPRVIPALFIDKLDFSPKVDKFLNLIPYTALAALICPGVLTVDNQLWYIGLIGAIVAAGLAWKKVPLGAIVILTVVILIGVYSIVPFFYGDLMDINEALFIYINQHLQNPTLDMIMSGITDLGGFIILILAVFALLIFAHLTKRRTLKRVAIIALVALLLSDLIAVFLKNYVHEPRPFMALKMCIS